MSSRSVCISLLGKIMAHINFIISKQGLGTITDNMRGTCFIFPPWEWLISHRLYKDHLFIWIFYMHPWLACEILLMYVTPRFAVKLFQAKRHGSLMT